MMFPRALQKGMMGIGQMSLAPSLAALGPNRYLREKDFLTMLGIALFAHLVVILIMGILPKEKVTDIPVRALSFKIGGQDRIAAFGVPLGIGATIPAVKPTPAPTPVEQTWRAKPQQKPVTTPAPLKPIPYMSAPKPAPATVKPVAIVPPEQRQMPSENRVDTLPPIVEPEPAPLPTPAPVIAQPQPMPSALPSTEILTQVATPAIAPEPQRYVREVGAAPNLGQGIATGSASGQGTENVMTTGTAQEIRLRYEQQISAWIQQHKLYPAQANGAEGRVVVRMRIDRSGYVRYYAIEQSSGNAVLDAAAIDMIRRANPVPAVPVSYPAGNLIEFLLPLTFRAP